ncbi:ABC transporter permease family protein [Archaeoglobus profundus]|uniref:ABC-2 type transporter transmembrane domain-containing protein n=1 Tax=Archaeoglobus profundus (strain DSM 5631 / JCM 9629 / NBRC 100127 / Av18) TaxID=572546 RepID=D2RIA2_ARCPA|nr:ABC transporter permease [Archaeoglobus profundus]ADB58027.1 hypothetical protein Arcpr_0966 [Archaeoglobus profundus DSM 5631]
MDALNIAKKDLRALAKERTVLVAVLLLISLSSLSQIVAMGLTILYSPSSSANIKIGLVGSAPIFERIAHPVKFDSLEEALASLKVGEVDAIIVLNESLKEINYVDVYIPKEDVKAVKVIPALRKILMDYQDTLRAYRGIPILKVGTYDLSGKPVDVPEGISIQFRFMYTALIPLIVVLTSIILGVYIIDILYEELGCLEVLLCCVRLRDVILAKILAVTFVSAALTATWLLGLIANGVSINVPLTVISSYITYILSVSVAMIVFRFSRNREEAQLIYSLIFIPLILSLLTFSPSPLSLIVKSSLSIFDLAIVAFLAIDLILITLAIKLAEFAMSKNL